MPLCYYMINSFSCLIYVIGALNQATFIIYFLNSFIFVIIFDDYYDGKKKAQSQGMHTTTLTSWKPYRRATRNPVSLMRDMRVHVAGRWSAIPRNRGSIFAAILRYFYSKWQ